ARRKQCLNIPGSFLWQEDARTGRRIEEPKWSGRRSRRSLFTATMAGMAKRGKILTFLLAAMGLLVLAAAGIVAWPRLEEEWWLHRLRTGDEGQRQRAAERLGQLGSMRALPEIVLAMRRAAGSWEEPKRLVQLVSGRRVLAMDDLSDRQIDEATLAPDCVAYYRGTCALGKPALPLLLRALAEEVDAEGMGAFCVALAITKIAFGGPPPWRHPDFLSAPRGGPIHPVNLLESLLREGRLTREERAAASEALGKILARSPALHHGQLFDGMGRAESGPDAR
ncbi:MAG TPA: hypothetical protein VMT52_13580, partial [Planctomycetota bacterium]|nr:hypothetical protein [Planctomycetota bacterium]